MAAQTDAQKEALKKIFRVEDGAILVDTLSVPPANRMAGYLSTEKKYGDFVLRLRMRIERRWDGDCNSGIEVRNGLQFDVHPPKPWLIGWIWDHGPNAGYGWLSPLKPTMQESFDGGPWKYERAKHAPKRFKFYYAADNAHCLNNVGAYKANGFGLKDMYGNVAEWTRSELRSYPYSDNDRRNTLVQGRKVVRGGSWNDRPIRSTSSYHLGYPSWQRVYNVGFRIIIE